MLQRSLFSYAGIYISMAVGVGLVSYRASGSLPSAIFVGLVASFAASYFLVRLDRKAAARLESLDLSDGDYPARISATGMVKDNPEIAMVACLEAVRNLPNFGEIKKFEPGKFIRAKTRMSMSSWGERITIQAEQVSGGTRLHLKSVPMLWTVTQDMRCNYQNVALILKRVNAALEISELEPREYFEGLFDGQ